MHPLFQAISAHFLTTRSTYWWGNKRKESVSRPYVQAALAIQVGPGAKAQPLHCDSYINHRVVDEVDEWDDERDANRETSLGMFVAGCEVTKENGGTQVILGSHLWQVVNASEELLAQSNGKITGLPAPILHLLNPLSLCPDCQKVTHS